MERLIERWSSAGVWSVRGVAWLVTLTAAIGCSAEGRPAPYRSMSAAQEWGWEGGARLTLRSLPAEVRPQSAFTVEFDASVGEQVQRACRLEVSARPPEDAARRLVRRGGEDVFEEDPRAVTTLRELGEGAHVQAELRLPSDWVWRTVSVEAQLRCGEGVLEVVDGASREGRSAFAGTRTVATVGVIPVRDAGRTVDAPRASAPMAIDGALEEPEWRASRWSLYESRYGGVVGRSGGQDTEVKVAWDDTYLYVAGELVDEDIVSKLEGRDASLWQEDVVEVFVFSTEGDGYLEIQGSPRGHLFDAAFTGYREGGPEWNGGAKTAASVQYGGPDSRQELGWRVEFAIPWRDVCAHT
ncbi:MAG: carbohydrate-binding family 9-like protein, partial [Nannocystaceae bacterium]